jgi:hypothetical protein
MVLAGNIGKFAPAACGDFSAPRQDLIVFQPAVGRAIHQRSR